MKQILSIVIVAFLLSSCHYFSGRRIHGDGNVVEQSRSVSGFRSIDVGGAVKVYVKQDSVFSVRVRIDNNLQEYIDVYREGEVLHIHQRNNTSLDATESIKVYVSAPSFEDFDASGACDIISEGRISSDKRIGVDVSGASNVDMDIKAPKTEVDATGAATIKLKGETKDLSVDGSGSTNIRAFDLLTENTDVHLSGAGDAQVFASVKLFANISGAASVHYKGSASVSSDISGAGSVKKVD